jgi:hypothetical protein
MAFHGYGAGGRGVSRTPPASVTSVVSVPKCGDADEEAVFTGRDGASRSLTASAVHGLCVDTVPGNVRQREVAFRVGSAGGDDRRAMAEQPLVRGDPGARPRHLARSGSAAQLPGQLADLGDCLSGHRLAE